MADARIPIMIELNVKGAVVAYPGDCIVLAFTEQAKTDQERAQFQEMRRRMVNLLGIEVIVADGVAEMAVIRKDARLGRALREEGERQDAIREQERKHDLTMPHKFSGELVEECPPNCPANPEAFRREREGRWLVTPDYHTERNEEVILCHACKLPGEAGNTLIRDVRSGRFYHADHAPMPDYHIERNQEGNLTFKKGVPLEDVCRRCFRKRGDLVRPACGDCPDFVETVPTPPLASDEALAALRAKLAGATWTENAREEIEHAHATTQEDSPAATGGGDAGWPDPASFSKPGDTIAQPPSYYELGNGPLGANDSISGHTFNPGD